jgi:chromate reductase
MPLPASGFAMNHSNHLQGLKIEVLAGTNRPGSATRSVAGWLCERYRALGADASILDLAELPPSIFHPSSYAEKPAEFAGWSQRVLDCHGLAVVTPEYNGSFPGVLKYFIDMLKFPESFEGRPVSFVGVAAGQWGALRSVEQLQAIFGYRHAHLFPERVFVPAVHEVLQEDGSPSSEIRKRLEKQSAGFLRYVTGLQTAR